MTDFDTDTPVNSDHITVADMIAALSCMPADARVTLCGSYETYDGFSHPEVVLSSNGRVTIREAMDPEYAD